MNKVSNFTLILISLIIGGSIFGYGYLGYLSKENDRKAESLDKAAQEQKEEDEKNQKRRSLTLCMTRAELDFQETFELNSYATPQKDNPDVRTWDSWALQNAAEEKLQREKENCTKLFGN